MARRPRYLLKHAIPLPATPEGGRVVDVSLTYEDTILVSAAVPEHADGDSDDTAASGYTLAITELSTADGSTMRTWRVPGITIEYPFVQTLPTGEIMVVSPRCDATPEGFTPNAWIFNAEGQPQREFTIGDGVEHVQVAADGQIWVGYFNEGILGIDEEYEPLGEAGLVRFDAAGELVWEYEPPANAEGIDDCYALNVGPDAVYACYYSDFPVVRISPDGSNVTAWPTPRDGARALAVHGTTLVTALSYDPELWIAHFDGDKLTAEATLRIECPGDPEAVNRGRLFAIARGRYLYILAGNSTIYRIDAAEFD